jgi:hypothetical protein
LVATKGRDRSIEFIIIKNRELKRNRKRRGEGRGGEEEKVMLTLWLYFLETSRIGGEMMILMMRLTLPYPLLFLASSQWRVGLPTSLGQMGKWHGPACASALLGGLPWSPDSFLP